MCNLCLVERLDESEYCFGDIKLNICGKCVIKLKHRILQVCPYCGIIEILPSDLEHQSPLMVVLICSNCERRKQ